MTDSAARPDGPDAHQPPTALVFDDPLGRTSQDDGDVGWGDRPASGGGAADLARFLDEKPPHHL
ncbi:hypothetical protein E4198_15695 [Streptomyces sp. RKND-216]|uniref:hypothetical protein n=1 Tax=Streptomyces sp. RKND-216 TaxID=2562581 RepID=UPI00109E1FEA|nr:hypothetical protein [Streptomyces sp. RKND-216]THA25948.1 hypothetical protein E4198_15695 [Streptomyces sp. RKND-216]